MIVDELFELVNYQLHSEPHILVKYEVCQRCVHRACTFSCPARCYEWNSQRQRIDFSYETCLECGTCMIVCDRSALEWRYPKGGYGVRFRLT